MRDNYRFEGFLLPLGLGPGNGKVWCIFGECGTLPFGLPFRTVRYFVLFVSKTLLIIPQFVAEVGGGVFLLGGAATALVFGYE